MTGRFPRSRTGTGKSIAYLLPAILRILERKTTCICGDFVSEMPLAQSTVSQHLKVLKEAGLIRGEVDGPRVCYCIEPRTLRRLKVLVAGI